MPILLTWDTLVTKSLIGAHSSTPACGEVLAPSVRGWYAVAYMLPAVLPLSHCPRS